MNILFLLIPLAMVFLGIAIWAFLWAVRSGQFDDMEGPAHRILMDDDDPRVPHRAEPDRGTRTAGKAPVSQEKPGPDT